LSQPCFECGALTKGKHHVVPKNLGGKKCVPLCDHCHKKVHRRDFTLLGDRAKILIIKCMHDEGFSYSTIAEACKMTVALVHAILQDEG
jgi:hypothetical protein